MRSRLLALGALPSDRPEDRARKEALVITALAITVLATGWTVIYLLLDRPPRGIDRCQSGLEGLETALPDRRRRSAVVGRAVEQRRPFELDELLDKVTRSW